MICFSFFLFDLYVCVANFCMDSVPFRSHWSCLWIFALPRFYFKHIQHSSCCSNARYSRGLIRIIGSVDINESTIHSIHSLAQRTAESIFGSTECWRRRRRQQQRRLCWWKYAFIAPHNDSIVYGNQAAGSLLCECACLRLDLSQCDGCISWKVLLPLTVQQI